MEDMELSPVGNDEDAKKELKDVQQDEIHQVQQVHSVSDLDRLIDLVPSYNQHGPAPALALADEVVNKAKEDILNSMEATTGLDLDGDGDVGEDGAHGAGGIDGIQHGPPSKGRLKRLKREAFLLRVRTRRQAKSGVQAPAGSQADEDGTSQWMSKVEPFATEGLE